MKTNTHVSKEFNSTGSKEELEPPGASLCLETFETIYAKKGKKRGVTDALYELKNSLCQKSINPEANKLRRFIFPATTISQWNDWRWQIRNRIQNKSTLERILRLTQEESEALDCRKGALPFSITPYYASLLDPNDPTQALRRSVVPVNAELLKDPDESDDPLKEDDYCPVPGIIHRYPDRVLFLVTDSCSTYCRYCTRSRMVGNKRISRCGTGYLENAIAYIKANPAIRDVLLSGGDPLTLSDERLEWLLLRLRKISHVEMLRIGTKVPMVLPQRITPALTNMLKRYHPLWISIHVIHPDEITPESSQACTCLADAGIPLGSQTVLLAGINDRINIMKRLVHELLKIRIRPYYLYQCDPVIGSAHFRTPVEKGLEIIKGLRGYTTGYGVPVYVIDAPGGGGKIPLFPDSVVGHDGNYMILKNYKGNIYSYPDNIGAF